MRIEIDGIALLTECELQIMKCIWDYKGDARLPVVVRLLNERFNKNWSSQAVSTFTARLRDKGFVSLERKGRTHIYKIEISKEAYQKIAATRFSEFWFDSNAEAAEYFHDLWVRSNRRRLLAKAGRI